MLWDQTKDLPKDRFKVVENIYAEAGCPIEVRLHLANFVESSFMTNEQVDERTAIGLAKQLIIELDAKIDALNDPDRVLDKRKLHELSDNLKVSSISSFTNTLRESTFGAEKKNCCSASPSFTSSLRASFVSQACRNERHYFASSFFFATFSRVFENHIKSRISTTSQQCQRSKLKN